MSSRATAPGRPVAADAVAERTAYAGLLRFLDDPQVTEVMVNAGTQIWVERGDVMVRAGAISTGALLAAVEQMLAPLGRRLDRLSPVVDARLADGSRVCAAIPPIAVDGPCLSIRRFADRAVGVADFGAPDVQRLLADLVERRCNVVVSGATSTGKTSLLNALCGMVPPTQRLITMEDTAELRVDHPHVVRLECRPATAEGVGATSLADLLRLALRLRPDRLVVGEIRGDEVLSLLQAMNTGHDGSLSTVHANSAVDAVRRVCSLTMAAAPAWSPSVVRELAGSAIDVVVHLHRPASGNRQVWEVLELGVDDSANRVLATTGRVLDRVRAGRAGGR